MLNPLNSPKNHLFSTLTYLAAAHYARNSPHQVPIPRN
jgi:hypothetical protein